MTQISFLLSLILALFCLTSKNAEAKNLKIVSSINPIYQISKFITGEDTNNYLLTSSKISEHYQSFKPSDIKNIEQADLIFFISNDLETNLVKIIDNNQSFNKNLRARAIELINSSNKIKILNSNFFLSKKDPHIWLNPENAIIIAQVVTQKVSEIDNEKSSFYQQRLKEFTKQVKNNAEEVKKILLNLKTLNYLIYHDEYKYFEDYYQLQHSSVILNYHHQILSLNDVKRIDNIIKNHKISCIFSETKEDLGVIERIASNNDIKLINTDILGNKISYELKEKTTEKNGYIAIIKNLANDFIKCKK